MYSASGFVTLVDAVIQREIRFSHSVTDAMMWVANSVVCSR